MKKMILFLMIVCAIGLISACGEDKKSSSSTSAMNTIPPLAVVID